MKRNNETCVFPMLEEEYSKKVCTVCKTSKNIYEFHKRRGVRSGRRAACKKCHNMNEGALNYSKTKRCRAVRSLTRSRGKAIEGGYRPIDMTVDELMAWLDIQPEHCHICHSTKGRLNIDHCHATGRVRKLLCTWCNLAVGFLERKDLEKFDSYIISHAT